MFHTIFKETIHALDAGAALADELWQEIADHYSGSGRHYHNLNHLDALATELSAVKEQICSWNIIILSIAYHDIIYNVLKYNNEEASASYAQKVLSPILSAAEMTQCMEVILATKSHAASANPDVNYFTDADLSILGAAPDRYLVYTAQIRREYSHYPDLLYRPGRRKVLKHFLEMQRIFKTGEFYEQYEERARKNLADELSSL